MGSVLSPRAGDSILLEQPARWSSQTVGSGCLEWLESVSHRAEAAQFMSTWHEPVSNANHMPNASYLTWDSLSVIFVLFKRKTKHNCLPQGLSLEVPERYSQYSLVKTNSRGNPDSRGEEIDCLWMQKNGKEFGDHLYSRKTPWTSSWTTWL